MERYENLRVLGQGTFGKCYLVVDRFSKQHCVIKQIDIKGMSDNEKKNTKKQAYILEALDHPNIIKFLGTFDSKAGYLNIVMSYADGGDLSKRIKQAKGSYFPQNVILGWFTQIALALKHIHQRKFIHRDLKCQNIFLTRDNLVKLGDFGIAKSLKQSLEKAKTIVGTPYYMSPQICDNKDYTVKTDIWSLGVVLYQMCSLKPPFESNSLTNLALKICRGQYSPIPNIYSKELKRLINDLLTIQPNKRPSINQVIKSPIIQSRIQQYITIAQKQQKLDINPDQSTIERSITTQSRKVQRTKPAVSPRAFENAPHLVMLPTSPVNNNIKQGKIKIQQVKKGKIVNGRKRQISQQIVSPRQAMKKNIASLQHEKKKTSQLKGKKIQEYHPPTKRKQDILLDQMYQSYYLKNIPIERDLQSKQAQFNNSVSIILKKYQRESLQLQFKEQTQSETLKYMLQSRLGSQRFHALLEIVRRNSGFPSQQLTKSLKLQQLDLIPLISLYYGGYVMNLS